MGSARPSSRWRRPRTAAADRGVGAWLVELAEITSPTDVPRAVADALGVAQRSGGTLTQSIVATCGARPALLVIDNCEHVLDGAAELVQAIVAGCPQVRMLATSRERLGVDGEQVLVVGPLDPAAGVELFHARALAADRTFDAHAASSKTSRRSAAASMAFRWPSSWPPLATMAHRPADLVARLDDRPPGDRHPPDRCARGTERCGRPSSGPTTC